MTFKEIVEGLSALLTPIIAVTTVYIAYRQYQVSLLVLKKDLYERRLRIFQAFMSYFSEIVQGAGQIRPNRTFQFYLEASESEFLFNTEVVEKADEIYKKGIELSYLYNELSPFDGSQGLPIGEERSRIAQQHMKILEWFEKESSDTRALLREQISLQERKRSSLIKLMSLKKLERLK